MDRAAFEAESVREGYELRETAVTPNERRDMHSHDFDAKVLVLEGIFILAAPDSEASFSTGETCLVPAGSVHAECGGPDGARYLVGRRPAA